MTRAKGLLICCFSFNLPFIVAFWHRNVCVMPSLLRKLPIVLQNWNLTWQKLCPIIFCFNSFTSFLAYPLPFSQCLCGNYFFTFYYFVVRCSYCCSYLFVALTKSLFAVCSLYWFLFLDLVFTMVLGFYIRKMFEIYANCVITYSL